MSLFYLTKYTVIYIIKWKCYQVRSGGCPLNRGTEPSVYINGLRKKIQNSKGGMLVMVTFELLFSFSLVLATFTGGAYTLGYTIGKLSSKRK